MKPTKATLGLVALVLVLGLLSSGSALAWGHHGPRVGFGVVVGGPVWWGPGYYQPYYYPPAYYPALPSSPPVYIEQEGATQPAPAAQPQGSWYYCAGANGYYPYVKDCPGGWQRVSPQPPSG